MSSTATSEQTSRDAAFGSDKFKANAQAYVANKRAIDAIATGIAKSSGGYDNFDDAIVQIKKAWDALRDMSVKGAEYTPPVDAGFGSNNAAQIGSSLTGDRTSVGDIRKAFANFGK